MRRVRLGWVTMVILVQPVLVWFVWYRIAGYAPWTVTAAQLLIAFTGLALIHAARLDWAELGFGLRDLLAGLVIGVLAYSLTILAGFLLGFTDGGTFRSYTAGGLLSGWLLTGVGEELLFAGALFNIAAASLRRVRGGRWKSVVFAAVVFALWHLPGYIAVAASRGTFSMGSILGRLALNLVSWLIFGTLYVVSGSFWLVAVAHASTDYPLTGLITEVPALGLFFMVVLVLGGWCYRRLYPLM